LFFLFVYHAFPIQLGILEIEEQRNFQARNVQTRIIFYIRAIRVIRGKKLFPWFFPWRLPDDGVLKN
jgi:hypothetical protein